MRCYDDPVEVRKGMLPDLQEGPQLFLWRGRLWKVRDVVAHWVETGPWWRSGAEGAASASDLLAEREVWRVEAGRPGAAGGGTGGVRGVFDLTFDWADGSWLLTRCLD